MKLALLRQGEYVEPVRSELQQLVASITTSYAVEHDAEGRQRVVCGKWVSGTDQVLATATVTRIVCTRPDARNTPGTLDMGTDGQVRIGAPGVYQLLGQVLYDTSAVGRRIAQLRLNGIAIGEVGVASANFCTVQVTETAPCVAGDIVSLMGYQNSGGALTVIGGTLPGNTFLRIVKVA